MKELWDIFKQAGFSEGESLDPENLALVSAPIARTIDPGQKVNLAEDYDFTRAARWLDTISGAAPARGARLDRGAFGFIAAPADPTPGLDGARPCEPDEADAIYIDHSANSAGYVEEVVDRIIAGMRKRNAVSHTGAIGVLEAFSLVERIGAATLQLTQIFGVGPAQAAPADGGC